MEQRNAREFFRGRVVQQQRRGENDEENTEAEGNVQSYKEKLISRSSNVQVQCETRPDLGKKKLFMMLSRAGQVNQIARFRR